MSSDARHNPLSAEFDAELLFQAGRLSLPGIDGKQVEVFEDLEAVRDHVHSAKFNVTQLDVVGPGGVPLRKVSAAVQGRVFSEDQGPIKGKKRTQRNVLSRMDDIKGPLAVLRRCKESQTRVKVYTRNHSQIRSIITGHIIAFDKHWNMVLKDCQEVYIRKMRNKTPSFGDVSTVVPISDLSIRADDYDQGAYHYSPLSAPRVRTAIPSHAWPNPFSVQSTRPDSKMAPGSSSEVKTHSIDDESSARMRKYAEDIRTLRKSCQGEEPVEGSHIKPKRRRRRRKEEIRFREVKQTLLRGEMVVMAVICEE